MADASRVRAEDLVASEPTRDVSSTLRTKPMPFGMGFFVDSGHADCFRETCFADSRSPRGGSEREDSSARKRPLQTDFSGHRAQLEKAVSPEAFCGSVNCAGPVERITPEAACESSMPEVADDLGVRDLWMNREC